jgi:hypothetical protein
VSRSLLPTVRNPVLALPATARLMAMPPEVRQILADWLGELVTDCRARAQKSWRQNKAPMAVYWKVTAVYAYHLRRAIRP